MSEDEREPATLTQIEDIDGFEDLDALEDPSELLRTVELSVPVPHLTANPSHFNDSLLTVTRPIQPLLEARTQPRQVPAELLKHAQPTVDMPAADRYAFEALIDANGRILIPEAWRALFVHRKVRVILRVDDE